MNNNTALTALMAIVGPHGEKWGLTIIKGSVVFIRAQTTQAEWQISPYWPPVLLEYLPGFIAQHKALLSQAGLSNRPRQSLMPTKNMSAESMDIATHNKSRTSGDNQDRRPTKYTSDYEYIYDDDGEI